MCTVVRTLSNRYAALIEHLTTHFKQLSNKCYAKTKVNFWETGRAILNHKTSTFPPSPFLFSHNRNIYAMKTTRRQTRSKTRNTRSQRVEIFIEKAKDTEITTANTNQREHLEVSSLHSGSEDEQVSSLEYQSLDDEEMSSPGYETSEDEKVSSLVSEKGLK